MRLPTTERSLFGERDIQIWAAEAKFVRFEKADVKVQVKIVHFDYGATQEYVLIEIATNGPECPDISRGVNVFKQNEVTQTIIKHMTMTKRDLNRTLCPHRSPDAILYSLTKSLQLFTYGM